MRQGFNLKLLTLMRDGAHCFANCFAFGAQDGDNYPARRLMKRVDGIANSRKTVVSCFKAGALRCGLIVAMVAGASIPLLAQTNLSRISGTVTDGSGAAVANCRLMVKSLATSSLRYAETDSNGFYTVPALHIGNYTISASKSGFKTSQSTVALTLNGLTANFVLEVGAVSQNVVVTAGSGSVALQTESHDISSSFSPKQLVDLPNAGRQSVLNIAVLGPASQAGTDEPAVGDEGYFGLTANSVNLAGLGIAHTQFLQDGVENVNLLTQTANVVSTVDASAGVTATLNGSPARFGQPGVVNVITKSGTNQFHGMGYDILQNDAANATNYFAVSKPPLRYNQFGGDLGGPILRDKVFGYFDYSGLRIRSQVTSRNRVPTAAERAGDFSADSKPIYDPLTYNTVTGSSSPFPGDVIPGDRINNFAKLWLQDYPSPNFPLGSSNINFVENVSSIENNDEEIARADWNMSSKNQATATFFHFADTHGTNSIIPDMFGGFIDTSGTNAMLQDTYILSPTAVNIARAGYNRGKIFQTELGAGAKNWAEYYGLKNVNAAPVQWAPPSVGITGYSGFGNPYGPDGALQNRFQYADEFDWKLGDHTVAFGGQFVRSQFDGSWVVLNNARYSFDGSATSQYVDGKRSRVNTGNGLADLLLGFPQSSQVAVGTSVGAFRESQVAAYIQDDWKVWPTLTLNLGIRYDFDNPPVDKNGASALYDVATNTPIPGTWTTNYNDWGPRFGFAWSPNRKMVVRGGYGIYYSPILYNNLQFSLLYAPNFVLQTKTIDISNPVDTEDQFGPSATGTTGYSIQKRLKDQSAQEWNLNIQQSLGENTLFTIAYIGNAIRHESARADANQPYALSPGNTSGILDVKPQTSAGPVTMQLNAYNASYNALAVSLEHRYSNGLQFSTSYTWSKAMDIMDADNENIENIYDPMLSWAPAAFDRTNSFVFSGIYDLPFGAGRRFANNKRFLSKYVIGGWRLSGIQRIASGQPYSIGASNTADTSYVHAVYAQQVCNQHDGFTKTRFTYFNTSCFIQPAAGKYGTARDVVRQPGINPTDISLFKSFPIVESQRLEFRADAFSVLNHPMFGGGSRTVNTPGFGIMNSEASGLRIMQVSLKYLF